MSISSCQLYFRFEMQHDKEAPKQAHSEYLDEYKIIKLLGAGYSAEVKLGMDLDNKLVAIKQYKHETSTLQTLKEELNVMKVLNHENLIKLIAVKEKALNKKPNEPALSCFAIILEYASGGELFDYVAETGKFAQRVARTYFHQMMNGIHYMHEKGYAHRDIKPQNMLLSSNFILKIADFGFSCLIRGHDGTGILHTKLGTQGYMAPEIPLKHYDGRKTDIFASGVILFIMYAGNPPFQKAVVNDPYYKLIKEKRFDIFWNAHSRKRSPGFFSDPFKDLIQKMLAYVPSERPTITEIAKHPWIKGSVCSHAEIVEEFTQRKAKMQAILEKKRAEKELQKQRRTSAIHNQGYNNRDNEENDDKEFMKIYNKEKLIERKLRKIDEYSLDDIFVKSADPAYVASILKQFMATHKLQLCEQESQYISEENEEYSCASLQDNQQAIQARYLYTFRVDNQPAQSKVEFKILFGETETKEIVVHFQLTEGNVFYFKRIVKQIRNNCFP